MIKYDLHVHSNYSSDASQSIEEIFQRAKTGGIKYLAICDHDNIDSIPEAYKIASQYKIIYIPGVELSCSTDEFTPLIPINTGIHILGLNIQYNKDLFNEAMKSVKNASYDRKTKLINLLNDLGYDIEFDEIKPLTSSRIKEVLVSKDYFSDQKQAKNFLNSEIITSVLPSVRLKIQEAIDLIHKLGGKAIWAHPYCGENKTFFDHEQVCQMMDYLITQGIDGFEAFHLYTMGEGKTDNILNYVEKFNLIYTLGSDRHHADNRYGYKYYSFEDKFIPYEKYINGIERIIKDRLLK